MNKHTLIINDTLMSPGNFTLKLQGPATEMAVAAGTLSRALLTTGIGYRNNGTCQDEDQETVTIIVTRMRKSSNN